MAKKKGQRGNSKQQVRKFKTPSPKLLVTRTSQRKRRARSLYTPTSSVKTSNGVFLITPSPRTRNAGFTHQGSNADLNALHNQYAEIQATLNGVPHGNSNTLGQDPPLQRPDYSGQGQLQQSQLATNQAGGGLMQGQPLPVLDRQKTSGSSTQGSQPGTVTQTASGQANTLGEYESDKVDNIPASILQYLANNPILGKSITPPTLKPTPGQSPALLPHSHFLQNIPPLHTLLKPEVCQKIANDDFVDFYSLLHPNANTHYTMQTQAPEEGMIPTLSEVQPKHKPLSAIAWCCPMARYSFSYIQAHPERAQNVLTHLDQVLQLVGDKADWVRFDHNFSTACGQLLWV